MKEKIDEVNRQFLEFYKNRGYKREENVMAIKEPRYPIYLYKKYLRALKYWQEELGISKSELILTMEKYLEMEYNPEFEYEKPKKEIRPPIEFER